MKRFLFLLITSLLVLSCDKDYNPQISVSPSTTLHVPSNGGTQIYHVYCSDFEQGYTRWWASANPSWISIESTDKSNGYGNGSFTINVSKNNSANSRNGEIRIGIDGYVDRHIVIHVIQDGNNGSGGNGGNNPGGDNPGGDNPGGGNTETAPSAPTNVSCQNVGNNYLPEISITWNSVSNATSYKVYRSSNSSSGYTLLGTTYYTKYSDYSPMNGKNYYKVKAVNSAGESSYSSYTMYTYDTSSSLTPATPTVSVSGTSTISISWSCATGSSYGKANKYEVLKRNPNTANYELLTTTTSTSYSDRNSHPGVNRYVVIAINDAGRSGEGYGSSASVPLSKPSSFSASKSGSNVKFTWSKVDKATGYQIFESSSSSGTYYILDEVENGSTTSLTRYYPASGTTRYFKIKAYWETEYGGSRIYSDFSSYKSVSF